MPRSSWRMFILSGWTLGLVGGICAAVILPALYQIRPTQGQPDDPEIIITKNQPLKNDLAIDKLKIADIAPPVAQFVEDVKGASVQYGDYLTPPVKAGFSFKLSATTIFFSYGIKRQGFTSWDKLRATVPSFVTFAPWIQDPTMLVWTSVTYEATAVPLVPGAKPRPFWFLVPNWITRQFFEQKIAAVTRGMIRSPTVKNISANSPPAAGDFNPPVLKNFSFVFKEATPVKNGRSTVTYTMGVNLNEGISDASNDETLTGDHFHATTTTKEFAFLVMGFNS